METMNKMIRSTFILFLLMLPVLNSSGWAFSKKQNSQIAPEVKSNQPPLNMVWVGKSDLAKSCAKERGIDPDLMAGELKNANITVTAKKKIHDNKMRIQECGTDKGDMNGYLIPKKDLDRVKELGFSQVSGNP
jgi:hypothetical protein